MMYPMMYPRQTQKRSYSRKRKQSSRSKNYGAAKRVYSMYKSKRPNKFIVKACKKLTKRQMPYTFKLTKVTLADGVTNTMMPKRGWVVVCIDANPTQKFKMYREKSIHSIAAYVKAQTPAQWFIYGNKGRDNPLEAIIAAALKAKLPTGPTTPGSASSTLVTPVQMQNISSYSPSTTHTNKTMRSSSTGDNDLNDV